MVDFVNASGNVQGTIEDDRFIYSSFPVINTSVYGNDGRDSIELDLTSSNVSIGGSVNVTSNGQLSGMLGQTFGPSISFEAVETAQVRMGSADDGLVLNIAANVGPSLDIDMGEGYDRLAIDARSLVNFRLDFVANNSPIGHITGFELLELKIAATSNVKLGNGIDYVYAYGGGSAIDAGAGDDSIYTEGGGNTVIGGAGFDSWTANTLHLNGPVVVDIGSMIVFDDGNMGYGVESVTFGGSFADDSFLMTQFVSGFISGEAGSDTFTLRAQPGEAYSIVLNGSSSGIVASIVKNFVPAGLGLGGFESFSFFGSSGDDSLNIAYVYSPTQLKLDGGAGIDMLTIRLDVYNGDNELSLDSNGQLSGNRVVASSIERLTVSGSTYFDSITGGSFDDFITGDHGNDMISGGGGDDLLFGGDGVDVIDGGDGDDQIFADDSSYLSADRMSGGNGNDSYARVEEMDVILEAEDGGIDTISAVTDFILPKWVEILVLEQTFGASQPVVGTGNELDNTIIGNDAANELSGAVGDDILIGGGGDDVLSGGLGADAIDGGDGNDTITFAGQPDTLGAVFVNLDTGRGYVNVAAGDTYISIENVIGSSVADFIIGSSVVNRLDGAGGDDVLIGSLGADALVGGEGIDTASYEDNWGGVFVNLDTGNGFGNAAQGDSFDSIENLKGSIYDDFFIGTTGANRLDGSAGNDVLIGSLGGDVLVGGDGVDTASYEDNWGGVFVNLTTGAGTSNAAQGDSYAGIENLKGGLFDDYFVGDASANRLDGAMGADTLLGAGGADIFVFSYAPGATSAFGSANVDTILDFTSGTDRIELAASAFTGLATGTLAAGAFAAGTAAADADDRILYDAATGRLFFDADGTGSAAAQLFAVLDNRPATLTAADFVVA